VLPKEIRSRVEASTRVCVFTGAGISAESGIPTFRDAGGLWENYRPEDLVTAGAWERDPVVVWRWHAWLQGVSFAAQPNPAHVAIAEADARYPEFLVITQNIDTLHERAGTKRMVKLHGDIMQMSCLSQGHIVKLETPLEKNSITSRDTLPRCPECGGICRPNVVWFGELLPWEPLTEGQEFAAACDLFLIVGTSGVVSRGYGFTEMAKAAGALIIEVNPEPSELSRFAHLCMRLPAGKGVHEIFTKHS
jgi:NAD-dependent deacetylase